MAVRVPSPGRRHRAPAGYEGTEARCAGLAWLRSSRHRTVGEAAATFSTAGLQQHKCPSGGQPATSGLCSVCVGVFLVCGLRHFTLRFCFLKHTLKNVAVETRVPELPNRAVIISSVSAPAKWIWSIIFPCYAPGQRLTEKGYLGQLKGQLPSFSSAHIRLMHRHWPVLVKNKWKSALLQHHFHLPRKPC